MRRLPTLVLSHSVTPVLISDSNKEEILSFTPTRNFNAPSSSFLSKKSLRGLEVQATSDDRLLMKDKVLPTIMYTQPIVYADDGSLVTASSSQTSSITQTGTTTDIQKDRTSAPQFIGAQTPIITAVNPSSTSIYSGASDQSTAGSATTESQSPDTNTPETITTTTRSYSNPITTPDSSSSSSTTQTNPTPAPTTSSSSTQVSSTPTTSNASGTSSVPNTSSPSTETSSTPTSTPTSTGTSSAPTTTSSSDTSSRTYSNPAASSSSTQPSSTQPSSTQPTPTTSGSAGSTNTQPASSTPTEGTSSSNTAGTGTATSENPSSGTTQTNTGTTQTSSGTSQASSGTTGSIAGQTQTTTGTTAGTASGTAGTTTTNTGATSTSTGGTSSQQVASNSGDQQDDKEAEFVLDDGFDPVTGAYVEIDPNALLGPYEMTPDEEAPSQGWGEMIFVNFLVFGSLGFLIWFMYLTYKRRLQEMIDERAINPEAEFIKARELNVEEKLHLQSWGFNTGGENKVKNVKVTNLTTPLGSYFDLNFDTRFGETQTIIANRALDQYQENCYFELEIMDLPDMVDVVIGLSAEEAHSKTTLPGSDLEHPNQSIGLSSRGDATRNGVVLNRYKFTAKYGETIGIGYNFAESRVYLFHNGKYLNDIPRSPSPTKTLKELEMTNKPKESKSLNTKGEPISRLNSDKNYQSAGTPKGTSPKDSKAGTPKNLTSSKSGKKVNAGAPDTPTNTLKTGDEDKPLVHIIELMKGQKYFPVIGSTGPCKVILNIGGAPFRIHHKSIAQGLL